jgi:tRNA (guanine26-N2/guanine27-N2)-dimethyltransferase
VNFYNFPFRPFLRGGGVVIKARDVPELKIIAEGNTKLWVMNPLSNNPTNIGPGKRDNSVFFNNSMEFNRDISVLVIEQLIQEKFARSSGRIKLLDGLAGTGARGVRLGNEASGARSDRVSIVINDHHPLAYDLILKNIELNSLQNAIGTKKNLNSLLSKNRFDYIDIDPFGSPSEFIDAGARMLHDQGILAVTATDTATLYGSYPKTCLRRYDAYSCRTMFSHELGVRILIGACVRSAARYNLGLSPLLVHSSDHYYRLYLRGRKGRSETDKCLVQLGYMIQSKKSNKFEFIKRAGLFLKNISVQNDTNNRNENNDQLIAGPLWIGNLFDPNFVNALAVGDHKLGTKNQIEKILTLWHEEAESPAGFYHTNELASELKISTPPLSKILNMLNSRGFSATRSHFASNAFKTDAGFDEVVRVFREL